MSKKHNKLHAVQWRKNVGYIQKEFHRITQDWRIDITFWIQNWELETSNSDSCTNHLSAYVDPTKQLDIQNNGKIRQWNKNNKQTFSHLPFLK